MQSSHKAELKINKLPLQARSCHMFLAMEDKVLMLLGKLCDNGMEAHLTKEKIIITAEDNKNNNERKPRPHQWNVVPQS